MSLPNRHFVAFVCLITLNFYIREINCQVPTLSEIDCSKIPKLSVLPGRGWCNLRNKEMGQVQQFTYKQCKTTPDGLFRIPDNTFILPVLESNVQLFAEIIDSWKNYSSVTSKSININADVSFDSSYGISGSYSQNYQTCKQSQVNQKAVTTRVQARYTLHTVGSSVDSTLDPQLASQLQKVIKALKDKNDDEVDYLLELVVREYGTHVLTRVDTGAVLTQEEYISRDYRAQYAGDSEVIKVAASARFFSHFKFSAEYQTSVNTTTKEGYEHNLRSSSTDTFGGMLVKPGNMSIDEWVESIPQHLVAIDREGDPLHFVVTPSTFPNEPLELVDTLRLTLQSAIARYYSYNKHIGCMEMGAKNFDYNANIDNNMCKDPLNNYTFGGVYQTCQTERPWLDFCKQKDLVHKNVLTQDFRCRSPYVPIRLFTSNDDFCVSPCSWWVRVFWGCCSKYTYTTYWCAAVETIVPNKTGLMFGGVFTPKMDNPLTQAKSCPPTFLETKIFEDLSVCYGEDYELGQRFATEFAGFFSCQTGNPLYNIKTFKKWMKLGVVFPDLINETTKACPAGYTQHTALVQDECLVNYCVKAGSYSLHGELPVILPPFRNYTGIFSSMDQGGTNGLLIGVIVLGTLLAVLVLGIGIILVKRRASNQRGHQQDPTGTENQGLLENDDEGGAEG